jgi:hypothetical protein
MPTGASSTALGVRMTEYCLARSSTSGRIPTSESVYRVYRVLICEREVCGSVLNKRLNVRPEFSSLVVLVDSILPQERRASFRTNNDFSNVVQPITIVEQWLRKGDMVNPHAAVFEQFLSHLYSSYRAPVPRSPSSQS